MGQRSVSGISVRQCTACQGIFLDRGDLGRLIEAETDWHAQRSADTAQLPRISPDTPAPPPRARARSYVDSLFQG